MQPKDSLEAEAVKLQGRLFYSPHLFASPGCLARTTLSIHAESLIHIIEVLAMKEILPLIAIAFCAGNCAHATEFSISGPVKDIGSNDRNTYGACYLLALNMDINN